MKNIFYKVIYIKKDKNIYSNNGRIIQIINYQLEYSSFI